MRILALIATALMQTAIGAESVPPPSRPDEVAGEGTLRFQPAVGVQMGGYFVRLEQTTLAELLSAARVGSIAESEEGHHAFFVCLTDAASPRPYRLWIVSDAEMGGPDHSATEVIAEAAATVKPSAACPQLPSHLRPVSLDRGIWLGTTAAHLRSKLGPNSGRRGEWLTFNYLGTTPSRYRGSVVNADVTNIVEAKIYEGRIVSILASKVTTY